MKLASALALLLIANNASSYTPSFVKKNTFGSSFVPTKRHVGIKASVSTMTMLVETSGGMEELAELTEKADKTSPLAKQARKSPSFFKIASLATIPLSAVLGFGIIPSRRLAAHAVGGIVTGIAGAVGKSRLDALTESSAKPAIAQAIIDNRLDDPEKTRNALQSVQEAYGLQDEDFVQLCTEIYSTYLLGMVKYSPTAKTSELKELESLKSALMLENLQVGEAHAAAAQQWYRETCLFTPEEDLEDPDHPDRQAMDKFLFLTERALRQGGETEEAFKFEMTRIAKAFNLSYATALDRVAETVEPFYQRALKSTRSKLGSNQVSATMLERARKTLGISDETAKDMHVAAFNEEVRELLGISMVERDDDRDDGTKVDFSSLKFGEGAMERLEQLREVLGLSETDADYEITLEATPLYQSTALDAINDVLEKRKTPDQAWDIMEARRRELLLKESSSKTLVSSMVMQALGGPLEQCHRFAKVNNEAATYDNLLDALEAKKALIEILAKSGWDEYDNFDETFCNPWDKKSANGFLLTDERTKIYRIFLIRSVRNSDDGMLSNEMYERVLEVKGLLGITDQQAEIEAREAFGPELRKILKRAMMEIVDDYTPELANNMKEEIEDVISTYRLSHDFVREVGAGYYSKAVSLISEKSPGGVPSREMKHALEALQSLFGLTNKDVHPSHMEYFGSIYKKSVLEAMGSTGVIRPDFRGALNDLQLRLGLSEDSCKRLFLEAVKEKMIPMVQWIGSELERTMLTPQQLAQRRGKDMGEDLFQTGKGAEGTLGLGAEVNLMSDIMELVDFYTENNIIEEVDVATDDEPVLEKRFPITALGSNAIDQEIAELLYRQFIVGSFTNQGPQAARYEASRETFAGILGLTKDKIDDINSNIGSTVYYNFVSNAMKTKGTLDQQDMMFLANIQGKLGLTPDQGEKMLTDAQRKLLSEEVNALMDNPTPESIKAFREKCNSLGMDLVEDVGLSKQRLLRMFEAELTPGLMNGEITAENSELFGEIQESLGLDPEEAEYMFENLLVRLSKNAMNLIRGELLRGRVDNTVDLIREIVRYAEFTDGDLGLEVDEALGHQIYNIFDSLDFSGEEYKRVEANKKLLQKAMNL